MCNKVPFDCQLIHVSTCNSTATVITLKIGNISDDDGYLLALNRGVSGTPVEVATPAGFRRCVPQADNSRTC